MAVGVHVVRISLVPINSAGQVVNKDTATMKEMLDTSTEPRVLADATIPNSTGNPTIRAYIEAEAGDDYVLKHVDQSLIITYDQGQLNSL
jgi:hypothetical protein